MRELTPAMKQYMYFKSAYPDCLLLFRMGDFYEMFFEDARIAAQVLEITLTKRGYHKGEPIPLAGVPYHALEQYLAKLIRAGIKVGICEQVEDPKKAKGVVKRDIVRIVTPGTIVEQSLLSAKTNNYLVAVLPSHEASETYGIAVSDLSTSEFFCTEIHAKLLLNELMRLNPSEILIPELFKDHETTPRAETNKQFFEALKFFRQKKVFVSFFDDILFKKEQAIPLLQTHFTVQSLEGFGLLGKEASVCASGALLAYLKETQKANVANFKQLKYYSTAEYMELDSSTITNLELIKNVHDGSTKHTLLDVLDQTQTPMGGRCIRKWILQPLLNIEKIQQRLDAVEELKENILLRENLRGSLAQIQDLERLLTRISLGSGNARDVLGIKRSLQMLPKLQQYATVAKAPLLKNLSEFDLLSEIAELLEKSIADDPPLTLREGRLIKGGYHPELDEFHNLMKNGKLYIKNIEEQEREKTGIKTLKIGFNHVFGYFIEVTRKNEGLVPGHYIRKQTTANAERYITEELKQQEEKVLHAEERSHELEYTLFQEIVAVLLGKTAELQDIARKIAELDALLSFSVVASDHAYVKPIVHNHFSLRLQESRHPVIEQLEEMYIPNDVMIDETNRTMIITGPNMAGKSSLLRQVALITLMAQVGSFVPCNEATISIVDKIFTRVGAHDDLTHGQSTFMVEMSETAAIVNNATQHSLILMDEIGRGTSTFDGVSIAWSVAEHITTQIKAKMLFATHYHVLSKLEKLQGVRNYNVAVKEKKDEIIFLRKLVEGGTDKSYGVHVAKLAGMPEVVIQRAREIQAQLEEEDDMHERVHVIKKEQCVGTLKKQDASLQKFFS